MKGVKVTSEIHAKINTKDLSILQLLHERKRVQY